LSETSHRTEPPLEEVDTVTKGTGRPTIASRAFAHQVHQNLTDLDPVD
jgi:hypothetical protein